MFKMTKKDGRGMCRLKDVIRLQDARDVTRDVIYTPFVFCT